jgi:hypothetical protein
MGRRLPELNEGSMLTTRVRTLLVCSTLAVLSACSSFPTTPTPARAASPVTVTLVQGTSTAIAGAPMRPAFEPLPLERLGTEFRFQGSAGGYL